MTLADLEHLQLTDFLDVGILQEIQDSFAAVAHVRATITDAAGNVITANVPTKEFLSRQSALADADEREHQNEPELLRKGKEYVAPIMVNNVRLGTIRMAPNGTVGGLDDAKLSALADRLGVDMRQVKYLAQQLNRTAKTRPAAIQFLYLLANAIARLCYQEFQLRQRITELTAVYNMTTMLAGDRDLNRVLQRTVEAVAEVMGTKAASIRLVDRERDELVTSAVFNLSAAYMNKGPVRLSAAEIDRVALSPKGVEYVRNMGTDPRVLYPQESVREGIVSMLSVGMRYKGKSIGVLRVYTAEEQAFSTFQVDLLKAVGAQAAAAIENARLLQETIAAEALEKQVQMAADVQMRMIPDHPPKLPGLDFSCVYVPCFELGGDFYDTIPLQDDNVGLVIADVSGKGVPASLIMASVRAALRAQVDNVYYLYEVLRRLNLMLFRDTKPSEFVTLFYGVLDARTRRLTYCNAGHPSALVLRKGAIIELAGENTVLGINPEEQFKQSVFELKSADLLLLYTDGLTDAMNFQDEPFGRQRLVDAFKQGGQTAEIVTQHILWELRKFVGMAPRTDDVTMMVVRVE